jgi:hypothetical protein
MSKEFHGSSHGVGLPVTRSPLSWAVSVVPQEAYAYALEPARITPTEPIAHWWPDYKPRRLWITKQQEALDRSARWEDRLDRLMGR